MSTIGSLPTYLTSLYSATANTSGTSSTTLPTIAASTLIGYFASTEHPSIAPQPSAPAKTTAAPNGVVQTPPWDAAQPAPTAEEAAILATTNFIPATTPQLTGANAGDTATQKDNQNLFTLYQAVSSLGQLAGIAQKSGATAGQLAGYNTRFQAGLQQVESFVNSTTFNTFSLQLQSPSSSVTSGVSVPFAPFNYVTSTLVSDKNLANALPGVSTSQSFDVSVTKSGTTTDVPIDLSQVQGPLTLDNIIGYVNQQLSADGFKSHLSRVMTSGSISDTTKASYGIQINQGAGEAISLSSTEATPSLYLAGTSGSATPTITTSASAGTTTVSSTPADQQGRLVKLGNLSSTPSVVSNTSTSPSSGNTTVQSTVVDSNGDSYVIGDATGNFGNELNQGAQGVYLSKYDSSGKLQWTQLLTGTGTASGYSLALNPTGGVVVAGAANSNLSTTGISNGKNDSFVAAYDANGNQTWLTQVPTLNANQANAVTVDSSGTVYIGGQTNGSIGAGQSNSGGSDAYLATLNAKGKIASEQQFGTSGNDQVSAVATTASGNLVVASVQNGQGILSEYTGGNTTSAPAWQINLGDMQNGAISGVTVSGNQIYVSGTTSNAALNAGGQAAIANASSGGSDAFVFNATDSGTSATANYVSYVGTAGSDQGNGVTVGPDGTVYLAGTTTGTFAGQTRSVVGTNNAFVAALNPGGAVQWTQQFGGTDGQSTGTGVAVDPTGSSVLDALGLPHGKMSGYQSVDLSSATSLQTGDSFQIQIQGTGGSTGTVTIGQGETLQSLATKINNVLLTKGKATVAYANGGEALKIQVNTGVTAALIAGPSGFDALSRLGIQAGTLSKPGPKPAASTTTASSTSSSTSTTAKPVHGLNLTVSGLSLLTSTGAGAAKATLSNVADIIQNIYQQVNAPPASTSTTPSLNASGPPPAYLTAQISNYSLALATLNAGSSSSSSTSGALI